MSNRSVPYGMLARAAGVLGLAGVVIVVLVGGRGGGGGGAAERMLYLETNASAPGQNRVLALRYQASRPVPRVVGSYPTGGSGSHDLSNSGVLDADQQVIADPRGTLLFAVNQGSDTVAAFHIARNGSLSPVTGSPFATGGLAPGSVGLSGHTLVVANKAQDGVRDLSSQPASYATFTVASDGSLHPTGTVVSVPPGSSPTQAFLAAQGRLLVSTEESGLLRTFALGANGALTPGPGSPFALPLSVFPGHRRRQPVWPAGLSAHPTLPLIYVGVPNLAKVAVYSYDTLGGLVFVGASSARGAFLPCWSAVSRDGRRLYTADAGSDEVSVFDIATDPRAPRQIQLFQLRGQGNPWNMALDPTERFLFILTPRAVRQIPAGEGNTLHTLAIGLDGTLSELSSSPIALPVGSNTNPLGLALVAPTGR